MFAVTTVKLLAVEQERNHFPLTPPYNTFQLILALISYSP